MSIIEKQLRELINHDKSQLGNFINKKSSSKFFAKRNCQELVKMLPIIIANTDNTNCNWLESSSFFFFKTEKFLDTYIDNLHLFDFVNNKNLQTKALSYVFFILPQTENQTKKIIDKILECDCEIDFWLISDLHACIRNNNPNLIEYMLDKYLKNEKSCNGVISFIASYIKYSYLINKNIDLILKNNGLVDLFWLKSITKNDYQTLEKVKNKISEKKEISINTTIKKIYKRFVDKNYNNLTSEEHQQLETILDVTYLIIEDICKNEQIEIADMNELNSGAFSTVLELGNKVLKIGATRGTKTFHNNPYVNAMLLRKEFKINDKYSFFVEVAEKLDIKSEVSEEELYQLYKKIRDIHLIWVDVAVRNVGRLLKDNKVYWRQELPITDERLGLKPFRGQEILKKGAIVVVDNDLIFDENERPEIINEYSTLLQKSFEERYQKEKKLNSLTDIDCSYKVINKPQDVNSTTTKKR